MHPCSVLPICPLPHPPCLPKNSGLQAQGLPVGIHRQVSHLFRNMNTVNINLKSFKKFTHPQLPAEYFPEICESVYSEALIHKTAIKKRERDVGLKSGKPRAAGRTLSLGPLFNLGKPCPPSLTEIPQLSGKGSRLRWPLKASSSSKVLCGSMLFQQPSMVTREWEGQGPLTSKNGA